MIHEVKMYAATCDNCREEYCGSTSDPQDDKEFLKGNMQYWGWHFTVLELCYCTKCYFLDSEGNLIIIANRKK